MRRSFIALLISASVAYGQQRSLPPQRILPQSLPSSVTLTLSEYNRLAELAARKPKTVETPPVPFVLSRASFKLRIENESLVGTLNIDGDVLQRGLAKIPLISGLTIVDAQQSQKPLPFLQEGPTHSAVMSGPGPFSISLNVAASLVVEAGRASFTLPSPPASSSLLILDMPGNHANVHVEPGLITQRTTDGGHTIIEATLEPGKAARVWWTTREIAAPVAQREVRFVSDIKTLVSVGDTESRVAALCDITVIQGEPTEFKIPLPSGYAVVEVTGTTLESSDVQSGVLTLKVREPARRTHQFLIAVERPNQENKLETPFLAFDSAQRETGELLVEGVGTMELTAKEGGGLRRIDVREAGPVSRSLARFPLQAAFRYHRRPGDSPKLALEWNKFPDGTVLSAIAERATVTTLMNVEGKSLTEVTLRVRNHAQPFVRVELPQGAELVSAEVEGQSVTPVSGPDGSRVPLLRAGFRPSGAYSVSFVYKVAGAAFAKSGAYDLGIPKIDIPVSLLTWEVSLPDRLEVRQFGGNALSASLFPAGAQDVLAASADDYSEADSNVWSQRTADIGKLEAGQISGIVVDASGAVIANAVVTIMDTETGATHRTNTDGEGHWKLSGLRSGPVRLKVESRGFKGSEQELSVDSSRPAHLGITLEVGGVSETVTVTAGSAALEREGRRLEAQSRRNQDVQLGANSANVTNLQRKVAGILPVRVDVPQAGRSYRFVRPLVLDEETKISFQYKSR